MTTIRRGDRIRFHAAPIGSFSLAGVQLKLTGEFVEHTGVVRHVRGDHPTAPMAVRLYVEPDDGSELDRVAIEGCACGPHVEVNPADVVEIFEQGRA